MSKLIRITGALVPVFGARHEAASRRVALDVPAQDEELVFGRHRDVSVAFLVDVTLSCRSASTMESQNVRTGKPVHVRRK